jgi:hypothetical protein
MRRSLKSVPAVYRYCSRRLQGFLLVAAAVVINLLAPGEAAAQCTDNFSTFFTPAGGGPVATPYQHVFPLGVGASLNAVVSTMNTVNTAFLLPSSAFVAGRSNAQPGDIGGGGWARGVVGSVETQSATSGTIDKSNGLVTVPPITGVGICRGTVEEKFAGYQFGFDLASLNVGGSGGNFHFGVTAGYFDSSLKDTSGSLTTTITFPFPTGTVTFFSPPGSFRSETQVPFLGLYGVYTQGNFFADAQVRQDFYLMRLTDPLNGLADQSQLARGVSAGGNVGYRIPLPSKWFVEPSGGAIWSRVQVDPISTPGTALFDFANTGAVKIDDIESVLGRASLRIGTSITDGQTAWQPFVTGTVFREFAANATATSRIGGPDVIPCLLGPLFCPTPPVLPNQYKGWALNTETTRIGTFGQVGVGTTAAYGNWLSYGRFDYKFGERVEGWNLSAGVRYTW